MTRFDVLLNNGQAQFTPGTPLAAATGSYEKLRLGDMDADGDLDLVYLDGNPAVRVALNNGTGTFTLQSSAVSVSNIYQLRLGDVDNDGDLDVVLTSANSLLTALNNG